MEKVIRSLACLGVVALAGCSAASIGGALDVADITGAGANRLMSGRVEGVASGKLILESKGGPTYAVPLAEDGSFRIAVPVSDRQVRFIVGADQSRVARITFPGELGRKEWVRIGRGSELAFGTLLAPGSVSMSRSSLEGEHEEPVGETQDGETHESGTQDGETHESGTPDGEARETGTPDGEAHEGEARDEEREHRDEPLTCEEREERETESLPEIEAEVDPEAEETATGEVRLETGDHEETAETAEQSEEGATEAERREAEQREAEAREAEQREAEQREAEAREAEQREAEQREAEAREAEQREAEAREAEQREAEQREAEHRDAEEPEAEARQPDACRPREEPRSCRGVEVRVCYICASNREGRFVCEQVDESEDGAQCSEVVWHVCE